MTKVLVDLLSLPVLVVLASLMPVAVAALILWRLVGVPFITAEAVRSGMEQEGMPTEHLGSVAVLTVGALGAMAMILDFGKEEE